MRNISLQSLLILISIILSGCTAFTTYEQKSKDAYTLYQYGNTVEAADYYSKEARKRTGRNEKLLWQLETAKVYQGIPNWYTSKLWFEKAEATVRGFEDEASIMGRDVVAEGTALATNQNALAYKGTFTDRILLNTYQALNYLMLGDLQGAAVESRRALIRQNEALKYYKKNIDKDTMEWTWGYDADSEERIIPVYKDVARKITPASSGFINPFTYWLRAIIHHMRGDLDKAQYEMKNIMLMGEQASGLKEYFFALDTDSIDPTTPYCFIIFENGIGPFLEESRIDLILPKLGYTSIALPRPYYNPPLWGRLQTQIKSKIYNADTICSTDALFSAEFRAQFPKMLGRTISSWIVKETSSRAVINEQDDENSKEAAYILTGLYKATTNKADLRTWRNRGNELQVTALPLGNSNDLQIRISSLDEELTNSHSINLQRNSKAKHYVIYIQGLINNKLIINKHAFDI